MPRWVWISAALAMFAAVIVGWLLHGGERQVVRGARPSGSGDALPSLSWNPPEPLPIVRGEDARIVGRVVMPGGKPAPKGTLVSLVLEQHLSAQEDFASACGCEHCVEEQLAQACEGLAPAIAPRFVEDTSRAHVDHETRTAADGTFTFRELDPGTYALWAETHALGIAFANGVEVKSGKSAEVVLELGAVAPIVGRVVSGGASGGGISDARVIAVDLRMGRIVESRSSADGSFTLEGLDRRQSYYVQADSETLVADGKFPVVPGTRWVELVLNPAASIDGIVKRDGRPVAGVKITTDVNELEMITDARGEFHLAGLAPGELAIYAEAGDSLGAAVSVSVEPGEKRKLEMALYPLCALTVLLVDPDGVPIPDVEVDVTPVIEPREDDEKISEFFEISDEEGKVELKMLPRGKFVVASGDEELGEEKAEVEVCRGAKTPVVKLVLGKQPGLVGLVVDENQKPIAGAFVEMRSHEKGEEVDLFDSELRATYTDAKGRFRVAGLAAGSWTLAAGKHGFKSARAELTRAPHDPDLRQTLVLTRGAKIKGRVLDANDRPLRGWEVIAYALGERRGHDGFGHLDRLRDRTGKKGGFTIGGLDEHAQYELSAMGPNGARAAKTVTAKAGDVELVLRAENETERTAREQEAELYEAAMAEEQSGETDGDVFGRVIDVETNAPILDAKVRLDPRHDFKRGLQRGPPLEVVTGSEGEFEFHGVPRGNVYLRVRAPGYAVGGAAAVAFGADSSVQPPPVVVKLRRGVELSGRVVGAERISLMATPVERGPSDYHEGITAGADGSFVYRLPSPGKYRLALMSRSRQLEVTSVQELEVPETGRTGLELKMPAGNATVVVALPPLKAEADEPYAADTELALMSGTVRAGDAEGIDFGRGPGVYYRMHGAQAGHDAKLEHIAPGRYTLYAVRSFADEKPILKSVVVPASGEIRVTP